MREVVGLRKRGTVRMPITMVSSSNQVGWEKKEKPIRRKT